MNSDPRARLTFRISRTLFLTGLAFAAGTGGVSALEQTSGVNLTASEGSGARQQGMAVQRAGFQQGADAVVNAPASMNDVNDFTFSSSHAEQFGVARFDNFAFLLPWHAQSTLGFALARYAVSGVESYAETTGPVSSDPDGLFTTSDWMATGSFARRFGGFDVGGSVHLLYRHLDQSGLGMRGDLMGQYTFDKRFRFGTYVRGLVPSTAMWEEGLTEYEAPEASLFAAGRWDVPYFYGSLQAGIETPGILQYGARSGSGLEGKRGFTDPGSVIKTSKIGAEFAFDFGLSLRAGFDEFGNLGSSTRLGMGYSWRRILTLDYAFSTHPYLDQSHRLSLSFTPSFGGFEGRNFRPHPAAAPGKGKPAPGPGYGPDSYPSPYVPGTPEPTPEEEELEEGEMQEIVK